MIDAIKDTDAVIIRSDIIDKEVIDAAPQLADCTCERVTIWDLSVASERNICVMNTPGQNANAVAELVFGMLIYVLRNYFDGSTGTELKGKRLGLYAFGNVAKW